MNTSYFKKVILKTGSHCPCEHDRVVVHLSLHVNQMVVISEQTISFDVGHAEDFGVLKVVDHIVQTMGLGERCQVTVNSEDCLENSEKLFLKLNDSDNHELKFTVDLNDIQKLAEIWQMSESEKYLIAEVMKRRGNKLIKVKQFIRAYGCYRRAVKMLEGSTLAVPNKETNNSNPSEARRLLAICLSNAALCLLHLASSFKDANELRNGKSKSDYLCICIKSCNHAIELEPMYAKAWFRLAKAFAMANDFEEAIKAGEKCILCLSKSNSQNDINNFDDWEKIIDQMKTLIWTWNQSAVNESANERSVIRKRTMQKYHSTRPYNFWFDDEDEIEKFPISVWSNDLAANMMSLHEELEAFGEKMPEISSSRTKNKSRLTTIQDEETDEDSFVHHNIA